MGLTVSASIAPSICLQGPEKRNTIIAAGAVVLENTKVESGVIYAGVPAKKVKDINEELIHGEIDRIANNYLMYSGWFKDE